MRKSFIIGKKLINLDKMKLLIYYNYYFLNYNCFVIKYNMYVKIERDIELF